jgi:hypothetical protein
VPISSAGTVVLMDESNSANRTLRPLKNAAYKVVPLYLVFSKEKVIGAPGAGVFVTVRVGKATTGSVGLESGQEVIKGAR